MKVMNTTADAAEAARLRLLASIVAFRIVGIRFTTISPGFAGVLAAADVVYLKRHFGGL